MKLGAAFLAAMLAVGGGMPVQAAKAPRALATDNRIRQVAYDPNQIYEVTGTYGRQTRIEFAPDETVKVVALGDTIAWQWVSHENRLFIKPVEPKAGTNLTVITTKRSYDFELTADQNAARATSLVRFVYPNQGAGGNFVSTVAQPQQQSQPQAGLVDIDRVNIDYSTSGNKQAIQLQRVFDDGQFTKFRFAPGSQIPVVHVVRPDGTPATVNTRREGQYLVAETTATRFMLTVGNGDAYLCVNNNLALAQERQAQGRN